MGMSEGILITCAVKTCRTVRCHLRVNHVFNTVLGLFFHVPEKEAELIFFFLTFQKGLQRERHPAQMLCPVLTAVLLEWNQTEFKLLSESALLGLVTMFVSAAQKGPNSS